MYPTIARLSLALYSSFHLTEQLSQISQASCLWSCHCKAVTSLLISLTPGAPDLVVAPVEEVEHHEQEGAEEEEEPVHPGVPVLPSAVLSHYWCLGVLSLEAVLGFGLSIPLSDLWDLAVVGVVHVDGGEGCSLATAMLRIGWGLILSRILCSVIIRVTLSRGSEMKQCA